MQNLLYSLIIIFGSASYLVGFKQMLRGAYAPSIFSRVVWLFLAINSFVGVLLSGGSTASILLAVIFLAGNLLVCVASFWKGSRSFGKLELACLFLLLLSGVIWIVYDAPLLNLGLSLFAHLLGGLPTISRAVLRPQSESMGFWSLFFVASVISVFASSGSAVTSILFPLYYTIFDGTMFALSARKTR